MNKLFCSILIFLSALTVITFNFNGSANQLDLENRLDRFIMAQMKTHHISGLAVAITHNKQVLHVKGYSTANNERPVTPQTQFLIGSLGKSFTAIAVMQLVEAGQINLDLPVQTYLPALPDLPVRLEHEYERKGAVNLFAAFDTRTGQVWGLTYERKRQEEFIDFLEYLDKEIPSYITTIHVVLDNLSVHKGKKVQTWLMKHPRFLFHHPPVHCSWMNQVEQWFSILQRKRLKIADFADKKALSERLKAFIDEWNTVAHPFHWSKKSTLKILAKWLKQDSKNMTSSDLVIAA